MSAQDDSWPSYGGPPQYAGHTHPYAPPQYGVPTPYDPAAWDPRYAAPAYRPSTAPAYACAVIFVACSLLSFILAVASWSGTGNLHFMAAVIGVVFSDKLTGNIDFGISATMTVACSTLTFALLLMTRLGLVRWILFSIGTIVSIYYLVALVYLVGQDAAGYVSVALLSLFLWSAATVIAVLPATGRAMRGRSPMR
jgi:hypothetical protein